MIGFVVGEAWRDVRRAGRVAVSAVVLITLSLAALGAFRLLAGNVERAVAQWRERVRFTVYLKREPGDPPALVARVGALAGVADVRYVGKEEALRSLRAVLGKDAGVVDQLPVNPLPPSLEVTPTPAAATPDAARRLHARLAELPEAEDVAGGGEWMDRLAHWQRLLTVVGLTLGAVLAVAAVLTVTTATTLVLHARRQETEIMRLVGAPERIIRLPLLLQGTMQGLAGAIVAMALLGGAHALVAPPLQPLLDLTLGLRQLAFLSAADAVALVAAGMLFGALGGWLAKGRA